MKKLRVRIVVDLGLAVLLILLMLFRVTGVAPHEIMGVAFTVLILVHLFLNRNWFYNRRMQKSSGALPKQQMTKQIWNSILIANALLVLVCGFLISEYLLQMEGSVVIRLIHSISAKTFLISCIAHIILHRQYLRAAFRKLLPPKMKKDPRHNLV